MLNAHRAGVLAGAALPPLALFAEDVIKAAFMACVKALYRLPPGHPVAQLCGCICTPPVVEHAKAKRTVRTGCLLHGVHPKDMAARLG